MELQCSLFELCVPSLDELRLLALDLQSLPVLTVRMRACAVAPIKPVLYAPELFTAGGRSMCRLSSLVIPAYCDLSLVHINCISWQAQKLLELAPSAAAANNLDQLRGDRRESSQQQRRRVSDGFLLDRRSQQPKLEPSVLTHANGSAVCIQRMVHPGAGNSAGSSEFHFGIFHES